MTTVVAIKHSKGLTFASDSQATGENGDIYRSVKISKVGPFIISGAGDSAPMDLAQYLWKPPLPTVRDREDLLGFMVKKVIPSLKKMFKEQEYEYNPAPEAKQDGFSLIIGLLGQLFIVEKEFDVSVPTLNIAGVGTGSQYAMGALSAGVSVTRALEIAAENDAFTSAPFTIVEQEK